MAAKNYTPTGDGGRDIQEVRLRGLDGEFIGDNLDSSGNEIPSNLKLVILRNAGGNVTSLRKTNGTVTMVSDVPTVTGETLAYLKTFLNYASGAVAVIPAWVKQ